MSRTIRSQPKKERTSARPAALPSAPGTHSCGQLPVGRATYQAATNRFTAGFPCVGDFRLAARPGADGPLRRAATSWLTGAAAWDTWDVYGDNNPLSSPVFDRCTTQHGSMTARQALDIMVGQPDLTDLELARLASILGRVTLAICVTSSGRPRTGRESHDGRAWCTRTLARLATHPHAGLQTIVSLTSYAVRGSDETRELLSWAAYQIDQSLTISCMGLAGAVPQGELAQIVLLLSA